MSEDCLEQLAGRSDHHRGSKRWPHVSSPLTRVLCFAQANLLVDVAISVPKVETFNDILHLLINTFKAPVAQGDDFIPSALRRVTAALPTESTESASSPKRLQMLQHTIRVGC